jgi:hypothetical protein
MAQGMHETLDWAQRELMQITSLVRREFCGAE